MNNKRKWRFGFVLALILAAVLQIGAGTAGTVYAADITVTVNSCLISGQNVNVTATSALPPASADGMYYLFELKPYELTVGARKDYCASAPAAAAAAFSVPLNLNSAASKLYSRFVVTVLQNGKYVPVSNEMYITNPEAVASKSTNYPVRSKKGLTADWRYSEELVSLGAGFASYELDVSRFFTGGGLNYTYNGKTYSFNAAVVREYDIICTRLAGAGCNVVMVIKNSYSRATADMVPPSGRSAGKNCYAFNVDEQIPTEKLEALMSFLAERYSGSMGTIHTWVIGNEVNSSNPWHYMGNVSAEVRRITRKNSACATTRSGARTAVRECLPASTSGGILRTAQGDSSRRKRSWICLRRTSMSAATSTGGSPSIRTRRRSTTAVSGACRRSMRA